MKTLEFNGEDTRDLLDVLIEAVDVARSTGKSPQVVVRGKTYMGYDLAKVARLLPEEPLLPKHEEVIEKMFTKPQRTYGRAGSNLAGRVNQIVSEHIRRITSKSLASSCPDLYRPLPKSVRLPKDVAIITEARAKRVGFTVEDSSKETGGLRRWYIKRAEQRCEPDGPGFTTKQDALRELTRILTFVGMLDS